MIHSKKIYLNLNKSAVSHNRNSAILNI